MKFITNQRIFWHKHKSHINMGTHARWQFYCFYVDVAMTAIIRRPAAAVLDNLNTDWRTWQLRRIWPRTEAFQDCYSTRCHLVDWDQLQICLSLHNLTGLLYSVNHGILSALIVCFCKRRIIQSRPSAPTLVSLPFVQHWSSTVLMVPNSKFLAFNADLNLLYTCLM